MTAIRAHQERRLLLDFSQGKQSKNKIKQALRQCNVVSVKQVDEENEYIVFTNEIKVGMYTIRLHLPFDSSKNWNKLRDYGDFEISIHDRPNAPGINLATDSRFRHQYWAPYNFFGKLRIKHLIDIIAHCKRLDNLKAFL
jgi:hypothetical protein